MPTLKWINKCTKDTQFESSSTFLIPCRILSKIKWMCLIKSLIYSSEQRMREHQRSQHASPGSLNNSTDKRSTIKDNRETKARRNEWRITKMVLAIFLSFLVCYLPITIAKVADNHVHYPGESTWIMTLFKEAIMHILST